MPNETANDRLVEFARNNGAPVKTVCINTQTRSAANAEKVAAIKDMLDVIAEDEVDKFFVAVFDLAFELDYKLQTTPMQLLANIERKHK